MELTVSQKAKERIHQIRKEQNVPDEAFLRVGVISGGCSGLTYDLKFDGEVKQEASDKVYEVDGLKILIDMRSFLYLAGTELDYSDGLNGEGFHFKNPNATRTCSCGESFSI